MLGAGAVLLGAFVVWERRRRGDPLIEPGLLANRTYTSGILVALAFFGAFGGLLLCVSLFAQLGEGFSPIHAGLTLIPMVVGMLAGMGAGMALDRPPRPPPAAPRRRGRRRRHRRPGADRDRRRHGLDLDLAPGAVPDRPRRRREHRPAVRLHPRRGRDGRGRLRLRRARGRPAALQRARRRGTRDDLLLGVRRAISRPTRWRSPPGPAWSRSRAAFALIFRLPMRAREPVI